jgi:hypothetical protein
MGGLNRIAVLFGIVAAFSWIMVALSVAQTVNQPPETPPHQTVPETAGPARSGSSTQRLSDKLDSSGGVIRPPSGIDPGLTPSPAPAEPGGSAVIAPPARPAAGPGSTPNSCSFLSRGLGLSLRARTLRQRLSDGADQGTGSGRCTVFHCEYARSR